ncbi:hypothetical protein [Laceyella putida]|uniref:Uncharacterized protein n=1 Tax=Laceyella putida TaxID=110101 RepID=A0ABW2RR09_9BACL
MKQCNEEDFSFPIWLSETELDILHQALAFFSKHLQDLDVSLNQVNELQQRLVEIEDVVIEKEEGNKEEAK